MCSTYIYWAFPCHTLDKVLANDTGRGPIPAELRVCFFYGFHFPCLKNMPSISNFQELTFSLESYTSSNPISHVYFKLYLAIFSSLTRRLWEPNTWHNKNQRRRSHMMHLAPKSIIRRIVEALAEMGP